MTKHEWFLFLENETRQMMEISKAKNADYTGSSPNPFANFEMSEQLGFTDAITGVLVRLGDKVARIRSFHQQGALQVKDESVSDTCRDLAVYALILSALFKDKKNKSIPLQPKMFIDDEPEYTPTSEFISTHPDRTETICLTQQELDDIKEGWLAP